LQPPKPIFTNPELEMISKEIEELTKERHAIEADVAQKEADIRIKTGEMRSLQVCCPCLLTCRTLIVISF